jgi:hypothetical protein
LIYDDLRVFGNAADDASAAPSADSQLVNVVAAVELPCLRRGIAIVFPLQCCVEGERDRCTMIRRAP